MLLHDDDRRLGTEDDEAQVRLLRSAMAHYVPMPARYATYHSSAQAASAVLGCSTAVLERLVEDGLPSQERDGERYFEYFDLLNVARSCPTGRRVPQTASRMLLRPARKPSSAWLGPRRWNLRVALPAEPAGRFRLAGPDLGAPGVSGSVEPREGALHRLRADVTVEGVHDPVRTPAIRRCYEDVLAELLSGSVRYEGVSEPLRAEHATAWDLGVADCIVTSRVLADRVRASGEVARARRGLLMGVVGSEHAWCEVFEDGRWKSVDVTLAAFPSGLPQVPTVADHREFVDMSLGLRPSFALPFVAGEDESLVRDAHERCWLPLIGTVSATARTAA